MIRRAVKAGVSSYVIDSVSPERLDALVEVAIAQFEAFQNLRAERDDATRKLSERITIDRPRAADEGARARRGWGLPRAAQVAMERGASWPTWRRTSSRWPSLLL
jgi:response regulator NasT